VADFTPPPEPPCFALSGAPVTPVSDRWRPVGVDESKDEIRTQDRGRDAEKGNMRESLGSLLVKNGVASDRDIKDAIQEGQETGEPLGKVLVRKGVASESQLGKLLAEQWQLQYLEADDFEVDEVAALRISRDDAARMGAAPIAYDGNTIVMAIVEPHAELFERVSRELGEAAYIVVSRSTFEQLTGSPPLSGETPELRSHYGHPTVEDAAGDGAAVDSVEHVEVEPVSSDEPIEAPQESTDARLEETDRLDELEQMLDEVLPVLRSKLTEQHEALAAADEQHRRDGGKIRDHESKIRDHESKIRDLESKNSELESELSRQGDLFEALRGQAAALAATFDEASK
jgi:Type II secretion system (T2SS), protein E, N-terminal domain